VRTQTAIKDFLHSCLARNLSSVTISWYQRILGKFARSCTGLPQEPGAIEHFLASIEGTPETKHAYFRALRSFFSFISVRNDTPNPMDKVMAPRRPKKIMATLEADELMRLLASAKEERARVLLTLLIDTGLRTGEVAGLRRQDIKPDWVHVCGKSGEREVPISEETYRLLVSLLAQHPQSEHVFQGPKGPLTRHGIYSIVHDHMLKAGISGPKLGAHRLRHAFGKNYLVAGGDLRSLQEIMGHVNISTTQQYAALNLSDTIVKHRQFTPLKLAHSAAQGMLLKDEAVKEAEQIVKEAG